MQPCGYLLESMLHITYLTCLQVNTDRSTNKKISYLFFTSTGGGGKDTDIKLHNLCKQYSLENTWIRILFFYSELRA